MSKTRLTLSLPSILDAKMIHDEDEKNRLEMLLAGSQSEPAAATQEKSPHR